MPVPSACATSPSASASSRMIAIGNRSPAPFMKTCMSSPTELSPLISVMVQATAIAVQTDHNTDVEPEPSMRLPSPVMYSETGIIRIIASMGSPMNQAEGTCSSAGSCLSAETSTSGTAPGQRTSPPRVRSSAFLIGPMSMFFQMTMPASSIAVIA